jgi:hypothetical protein
MVVTLKNVRRFADYKRDAIKKEETLAVSELVGFSRKLKFRPALRQTKQLLFNLEHKTSLYIKKYLSDSVY